MQADHFNLQARPFFNAPGDWYFQANAEVAATAQRIARVLTARDAIAVVSGGPGVGKSALVEFAWSTVSEQAVVAHVDLRQADPAVLQELLLLKLGGDPRSGTDATVWHRLADIIRVHNNDGRMVTAAIDVSQLTVDCAKRILRLVNLTAHPGAQLNFILQGPHILHRLLNIPGLIHLRQRISHRQRVRPLTVPETGRYIDHQISSAGGQPEHVVSEGVAPTVHRYVGGVPRLINTMLDAALTESAIQGADRVTADTIGNIAHRLGWKPLVTAQPVAQRPAPKRSAPVVQPAATKPAQPDLDKSVPVLREEAPKPEPNAALTSATGLHEILLDNPAADAPAGTSVADAGAESQADVPGIAAMNPQDPGATGMLRLEDLDDRFAETIFGDESGIFKTVGNTDRKKAQGGGE
jgi:type II secretory pathway predicted ATPase ExeA